MLVAYGPQGQIALAEERALPQLQNWSREHALSCPNCRGVVHLRGGPARRTQLHFAHQKGECAWSTEPESARHMSGKNVLAQWLRAQFPLASVSLEERLPGPNRIADVFVRHDDGRQWAIEFQCATLAIEEWQKRHTAYRQAGILDIWVIGINRREKQEAFLEAILLHTHELLFLDPESRPVHTWLRWPLSRATAQAWLASPRELPTTLTLGGWVGCLGYGATLSGTVSIERQTEEAPYADTIHLDEQGKFLHPVRDILEERERLRSAMEKAHLPSEEHLRAFLRSKASNEALNDVLLPLLRSYLRDPELLQRYNYGRGQPNLPPSNVDRQRIQKAQQWIQALVGQKFSLEDLRQLQKALPFFGPYAAFSHYMESLLLLATLSEKH